MTLSSLPHVAFQDNGLLTCDISFLPPLDTLVAVLERDTLGVREVRLFGAAVRWAEAEAHRQQLQPTPENKRKVLGKALTLIRFPLMTIEEFAAGEEKHRTTTLSRHISLLSFSRNSFSHLLCSSDPDPCLWSMSSSLQVQPSPAF